jgi:hypothetical protein
MVPSGVHQGHPNLPKSRESSIISMSLINRLGAVFLCQAATYNPIVLGKSSSISAIAVAPAPLLIGDR